MCTLLLFVGEIVDIYASSSLFLLCDSTTNTQYTFLFVDCHKPSSVLPSYGHELPTEIPSYKSTLSHP